jgi:hypothetical protein
MATSLPLSLAASMATLQRANLGQSGWIRAAVSVCVFGVNLRTRACPRDVFRKCPASHYFKDLLGLGAVDLPEQRFDVCATFLNCDQKNYGFLFP